MKARGYSQTVETARNYYNSSDADGFYAAIWGGEDIHIGLYASSRDTIETAGRRTVERMAQLAAPTASDRVLDLGAGYGGAARLLASVFGCQVDCVNLSEVQNERNRRLNREAMLDGLINVIDANFEEIPLPDRRYSLVWSQDALLHSAARDRALAEAARLLRPGGRFIFTDPMQSDSCPPDALGPVLARLQLSSMASPGYYCDAGQRAGFTNFRFEDHSPQLVNHYRAVRDELRRRFGALSAEIDPKYLSSMEDGLGHWIEAGRRGHLAWGFVQMDRL